MKFESEEFFPNSCSKHSLTEKKFLRFVKDRYFPTKWLKMARNNGISFFKMYSQVPQVSGFWRTTSLQGEVKVHFVNFMKDWYSPEVNFGYFKSDANKIDLLPITNFRHALLGGCSTH